MKVTWGGVGILVLIVVIVLFIVKVFIWEIVGIAAFVALVYFLYKRLIVNKQ